MKLEESFYLEQDPVKVAKALLGKFIFTRVGGKITAGMIVETEAYSSRERGSHAYRGETPRNKVMYEAGGVSYVYLCYGIHHLFNVVTNEPGTADAVLIRALEPKIGMDLMLKRMKAKSIRRITSGPGKLTKSLGIGLRHNGKRLWDDEVWIEEGMTISKKKIRASPRIGIDYAGEDANLPWRFTVEGNPWVSKP